MLRKFIYLLASILVLALLRGVIGMIWRSVGQLFQEEQTAKSPTAPAGAGGELVKCAACGVYFDSQKTVRTAGNDVIYCSATCRDRSPA